MVCLELKHLLVGSLEDFGDIGALAEGSYPPAKPQLVTPARILSIPTVYGLKQTLDSTLSRSLRGPWQQDKEFTTTVANDDVRGPEGQPEQAGDLFQNLVTHRLTEGGSN